MTNIFIEILSTMSPNSPKESPRLKGFGNFVRRIPAGLAKEFVAETLLYGGALAVVHHQDSRDQVLGRRRHVPPLRARERELTLHDAPGKTRG